MWKLIILEHGAKFIWNFERATFFQGLEFYNNSLFCFFMRDKIRNITAEFSSNYSTNHEIDNSLIFKRKHSRTLGTQDDTEDKSNWNIQTSSINHFYSPHKSKYDTANYSRVMEENQRLKDEVRGLKELLANSHAVPKNYGKIDGSLHLKKDDKTEQIMKLKKILEKSYYSIKQMEDEISRLSDQLSSSHKNFALLQKKCKLLELQKQECESKLGNVNLVHKQEIEMCNDRIWRLQMKIKELIQMIEQDQLSWNLHTLQLSSIKKSYHKPNSR